MGDRQFEDGSVSENGLSLVARHDGGARKSYGSGSIEDLAEIEDMILSLQMQAVRLERIYEALKSRKGGVSGRKPKDN